MPHSEERLRFFTFVRALPGIDYDGDELVVSLRCEDPGEIQEALRRDVGDFARGWFHEGVLFITFAGGDGDPDRVGQRDYEHARQVERVLEPHQHQIFIPRPDGYYWSQFAEWKRLQTPQPQEASPVSAPVKPSLDRA